MRKFWMIGTQWLWRGRAKRAAPVSVEVRRATLPPQWEKSLMHPKSKTAHS
jgi:hypothetical protein